MRHSRVLLGPYFGGLGFSNLHLICILFFNLSFPDFVNNSPHFYCIRLFTGRAKNICIQYFSFDQYILNRIHFWSQEEKHKYISQYNILLIKKLIVSSKLLPYSWSSEKFSLPSPPSTKIFWNCVLHVLSCLGFPLQNCPENSSPTRWLNPTVNCSNFQLTHTKKM